MGLPPRKEGRILNRTDLQQALEDSPIIMAIKDDAGLARCLDTDKRAVFVLYGTVNTIPSIVQQLKEADKLVFVDIDLLDGLSAREAAVDYLLLHTCADGIISTKAALTRYAKGKGFLTVHRTFLLDSMALESIRKAAAQGGADCIEILPGVMPRMIRKLAAELPRPLIASGLLADKEDVVSALSAGALAISTTCQSVWEL